MMAIMAEVSSHYPFKDEAQTAYLKAHFILLSKHFSSRL